MPHFLVHTLGFRFLFALITAIGLWVWRTETTKLPGIHTVTVPNPIPVEITGVPSGLIVVPQPNQNGPQQVTVQAKVPTNKEPSLSLTWFRATIDVSVQKTAGTQLYPVEVVSLEAGVTPINPPVPKSLPVTLDTIGSRTLPIDILYQGNLPSGYTHSAPVLDNKAGTVTIRGPDTVLQQIASVVAVIRLDNQKSTFHETVSLIPQNARNGDVPTDDLQLSPKTVGITLNIQQPSTTRAVAVVPAVTGQPAVGYVVAGMTVSPASETLVGNPSVLDGLPASISAGPIDVTNATGNVTKTVSLQTPQNTSLVGDAKVQVTVQIQPIPSSAVLAVAPTIIGAAAGTQVNLSVSSINVTLQGDAATLKAIQPKDIGITVDVAGLSAGDHIVTPMIDLPKGVTAPVITPDSVRVTVIPPPTATPTATPTRTPTHTPAPSHTPTAAATPVSTTGAPAAGASDTIPTATATVRPVA